MDRLAAMLAAPLDRSITDGPRRSSSRFRPRSSQLYRDGLMLRPRPDRITRTLFCWVGLGWSARVVPPSEGAGCDLGGLASMMTNGAEYSNSYRRWINVFERKLAGHSDQ